MKISLILFMCAVAIGIGVCEGGKLKKNFYGKTCPLAEEIVKNVTESYLYANPSLPAKLLRMHFHDCFVRGCDGSILINSTANGAAEKDAIANPALAGFDAIDAAKAKLEEVCPGVVSCADILALAARDSVSFQFQKPMWDVLTGRRDGRVSHAEEAEPNLPNPLFNFTTLQQRFAAKGLTITDLVVLSGAHTLGISHCNFFSNRLYNFTGKGDADPSLDPAYAAFLRTKCQNLADKITTVSLDLNSELDFDNNYYLMVKQHKGLLQSDAALLTNKQASNIVTSLTKSDNFFKQFRLSMQRLGAVDVLTGNAGEIRKKCWVVNS